MPPLTEKEEMLSGEVYSAVDPVHLIHKIGLFYGRT